MATVELELVHGVNGVVTLDTGIRQHSAYSGFNYAFAPSVWMGMYRFAGSTTAARCVVQFNLAGFPSGFVFESAYIRMRTLQLGADEFYSWDARNEVDFLTPENQTAITWNTHAPTFITGVLKHGPFAGSSLVDPVATFRSIFPVEDLVHDAINNKGGILSVNIYADPEVRGPSDYSHFWDMGDLSDAYPISWRPHLILTYDDTQLRVSPGAARGTTPFVKTNHRRLCTAWDIERDDATHFRYTDHDVALTLPDGNSYTPVMGVWASARQQSGGLRSLNVNMKGSITSSEITEADLHMGLFRGAKVTEYLVDWMYPWGAALKTSVYWMDMLTWNGESWEADIVGLAGKLGRPIGSVYSRNCRHTFCDTRCKLDLADFKEPSVAVTGVTQGQTIFEASTLDEVAPDSYSHGHLTWLTGNNAGMTSEIAEFYLEGPTIQLAVPTPYPIEIGNDFDIWAGCDKKTMTCFARFSNFWNFGGFPAIPSPDKMMIGPGVSKRSIFEGWLSDLL